jgi:hypothetical protein
METNLILVERSVGESKTTVVVDVGDDEEG